MSSAIEHEHVHPAVANWLDMYGFEWDHEVQLNPQSGKRIDFLATHPDVNTPFLIECKYHIHGVKGLLAAFKQIDLYAELLGDPSAVKVLAIFKREFDIPLAFACLMYGIKLLVLDYEVIRKGISDESYTRLPSGELELPYITYVDRRSEETVRWFGTIDRGYGTEIS